MFRRHYCCVVLLVGVSFSTAAFSLSSFFGTENSTSTNASNSPSQPTQPKVLSAEDFKNKIQSMKENSGTLLGKPTADANTQPTPSSQTLPATAPITSTPSAEISVPNKTTPTPSTHIEDDGSGMNTLGNGSNSTTSSRPAQQTSPQVYTGFQVDTGQQTSGAGTGAATQQKNENTNWNIRY